MTEWLMLCVWPSMGACITANQSPASRDSGGPLAGLLLGAQMKCELCKGELGNTSDYSVRMVKDLSGPVYEKRRTLKCRGCGKFSKEESDLAPKGSHYSWAVIELIVKSSLGHTAISRALAVDYNMNINPRTIRHLRLKYSI